MSNEEIKSAVLAECQRLAPTRGTHEISGLRRILRTKADCFHLFYSPDPLARIEVRAKFNAENKAWADAFDFLDLGGEQ